MQLQYLFLEEYMYLDGGACQSLVSPVAILYGRLASVVLTPVLAPDLSIYRQCVCACDREIELSALHMNLKI